MNPFWMVASVLMVLSAVWSFWHGAPLSGGIALCYAAANVLLAFVKS
jgi:hypothetical protein